MSSGIIIPPDIIGMKSKAVRPSLLTGQGEWGKGADVLGRYWEHFKPDVDTAACWDFTRRRGDPLHDLSVNGNDLTLSGDVARVADGPWGWSYDFPGSDDYLITSGNPSSLQITGDLTVEVICKYDAANVWPISKADVGDNNRAWFLGSAGGIVKFIISNSGSADDAEATIDDAVIPVSTVLYIAGIFKPSTYVRLVVNGNLVAEDTSSVPSSIYNSDQDVVVGGYMNSDTLTGDFNGKVYMVRITPRAKTLKELHLAGGRFF